MKEENPNFEFLVVYITSKVVKWIKEENNVDTKEGFSRFINSETFEKLCQINTGMYIESPGYVYEIYKEELIRGTIRGITE